MQYKRNDLEGFFVLLVSVTIFRVTEVHIRMRISILGLKVEQNVFVNNPFI